MYIAKQRFLNLGIAKFVLRYVGQQQIPVPRTPSKGGDPVHYLSVLVEKSEIKPTATHCLISIVSAFFGHSHFRGATTLNFGPISTKLGGIVRAIKK